MLLVLTAAGMVVGLLAGLFGRRPGPKRTWLFETEDGERANPLADLSAGAADSVHTCRRCKERVDDGYRYCDSCFAVRPADD